MKKNKKNTKVLKKPAKISKPQKKVSKPVKKSTAIKTAPRKKTIKPGSPFSKQELKEIKKVLLASKEEISKNIEHKKKYDVVENDVGDQMDEAAQSLEKEVVFGLSDTERQILDDIEAALRKIESGKYGKCEQCGIVIEKKRMKALPQSRYCLNCQRNNEKYR